MLPFLLIFIVFCIVLAYYIKKNDAAQEKVMSDYWEKELKSNAVRKKDISKLNYITIPLEKIPQKLHTSAENTLFSFADKPMLNLSGISNTDLKLEYGTANLELLSEYDINFTDMLAILPVYTQELLEAEDTATARMLLEFAIDCNADSRIVYQQLSTIYTEANEPDKILWLLKCSEELPPMTKQIIQNDLHTLMQG